MIGWEIKRDPRVADRLSAGLFSGATRLLIALAHVAPLD